MKNRSSMHLYLPLFLTLLPVSLLLALRMGTVDLSYSEILRVFLVRMHLSSVQINPTHEAIIWQLRLPRILMALVTGGGLSLVGVLMQALVRNPLAEPYVLGLSGGASVGAVLFSLGFLPPLLHLHLTLPLAAFAGSMLAIGVVFLLARRGPILSASRLLLAGVALSSFLAALTSFLAFASPEPDKIRMILFWLLGSFSLATWSQLPLPVATTLLGFTGALLLTRPLDAFLLGEEQALHLGFHTERLKRGLLVLSALITGTLVAFTGVIGFVGLIIPHTSRMLVGPSHARVLPISFLLGAILMIWTDTFARTLFSGQEIPVGILTALLGVPFFLFLLQQLKEEII